MSRTGVRDAKCGAKRLELPLIRDAKRLELSLEFETSSRRRLEFVSNSFELVGVLTRKAQTNTKNRKTLDFFVDFMFLLIFCENFMIFMKLDFSQK